MQIAIIGLGGVGGYLISSLVKTPHKVVGFARGNHLKAIQKDGLKIIEDSSSSTTKINVKSLEQIDGYFDIVLFCVKAYDLESSYKLVENHIDSKTTLLSFSNGVSSSEILRKLSNSIILDGCIYILSHIREAGVIRKKGQVFAAVFGGSKEETQILIGRYGPYIKSKKKNYKLPKELDEQDIKALSWKEVKEIIKNQPTKGRRGATKKAPAKKAVKKTPAKKTTKKTTTKKES